MPTIADIANISATPRKEGWGTLSDVLNYVNQNMLQQQFGYKNPVTGFISEVVGIPAAARVAERLAYGQPITNIGKANVRLIPQDTAEAVGLAAPIVGSYGKFAGRQIGKAIDKAMVEGTGPLAKASIQPLRMVESYEYRGMHKAPGPDFGAPLYDLTGGGHMYPSDVYSASGARIYGTGYPQADKEAFDLARQVRGNPNAEVMMYRAVPKDESIKTINPGDWVTLSKSYAKNHGESVLGKNYKIIAQKVKAKELWTNADSIHEFGYHPSSK